MLSTGLHFASESTQAAVAPRTSSSNRNRRLTVVVSLANKLARIAWAVLRSDGGFVAMANLT
jgi:hypothetical protein